MRIYDHLNASTSLWHPSCTSLTRSSPPRKDFIFTPFFLSVFTSLGMSAAALSVAVPLATALTLTAIALGVQALMTKTPDPEDGHAPKQQTEPFRIWVVGRVRLAGSFMMWEAKGKRLFAVQAIAGHRIKSVNRYWLHSQEVEIDGNGRTTEDDDGPIGDNVWLYHRLGMPVETPYTDITRHLAVDNVWTDDCRGDGQASVAMIAEQSPQEAQYERFPYGPPSLSVEVDGAYVFDYRISTDANNPDAWVWSRNSMLILCWHMCFNEFGFRRDFSTAVLPVINQWVEEANICDEDVPLAAGGTEKRYQCNGWDTAENGPKSGLASILATCDGWICERGDGAIVPKVGKFRETYVETLDESDIVGHSIQYDNLFEDECNRLVPKFTYPDNDYTSTSTDYFEDTAAQLISGRVLANEGNYKWCQSWRQARRLGKRDWQKIQQKVKGSLDIRLSGINAAYSRWIRLNTPTRFPKLHGRLIENRKATIALTQGGFSLDFGLHPENIDAWNPATDEGRVPAIAYKPNDEGIISPTVYSITAISSGTSVFLRVVLVDPEDSSLTPHIRYRISAQAGGATGLWVKQPYKGSVSGGYLSFDTNPVPTDTILDVQVSYTNRDDDGNWTTTEEINTVVNNTPPAAVQNVGVSVGESEVHYSWHSPNDANYAGARIYYNTVDNFATASAFNPAIYGPSNTDFSRTEALTEGTWYSWIVSFNSSGVGGNIMPTGPFQISSSRS